METRTELISELLAVIGRFRRTVRTSAQNALDTSGLTESQVELLRLVGRQPGISVSAAAAELRLAPNTASTLVSRLSVTGLLDRTTDSDDRRVIRLQLSPDAQRLADQSRAARRVALSEVLGELEAQDLHDLHAGLLVLQKVTETLQARR